MVGTVLRTKNRVHFFPLLGLDLYQLNSRVYRDMVFILNPNKSHTLNTSCLKSK